MNGNSLKLYRVIEDAWADGLQAWFEAASQAALDGADCWLIVAHRAQAHWLKSRALRAKLALFGIRFFDLAMLREELCAQLGVRLQTARDETAEFFLKTAALRREHHAREKTDTDSQAAARNPSACLRAMTELSAANWRSEKLDISPQAARDFWSALRASNCWRAEIDRALVRRIFFQKTNARKQPSLWSCFVGFGADFWPEINLLEAAARSSERCEIFLPMPRVCDENVQQLWIDAVEARLVAEKQICAASDFHSQNEPLISRLEGSDFSNISNEKKTHAPRLLVGRDWRDEVRLVRDETLAWLSKIAPDEMKKSSARLAIIAPQRSPTSLALAREFEKAGIFFLDEIGENIEPPPELQIQSRIIRYHLRGHDVGALLDACKLLHEHFSETWRWLEPARVFELLSDAFCGIQSRNARLLVCGESEPWRQIEQLIAILGKWDGEILSWNEARKKWAHCLAQIGISVESLEPLWTRTRSLLRGENFPAISFLEWLDSALAQRVVRRVLENVSPAARVVVTTLAGAQNQTWSRIIFLDCNEGIWPLRAEENPFLDDAARAKLNAQRDAKTQSWLLTSSDHANIEQAHFLNVVEHCSGEIFFAAALRDAENPLRELQPNEWVIRCLLETNDAASEVEDAKNFCAKSVLARWDEAVCVCDFSPCDSDEKLDENEHQHLQIVHASRRDPLIPFDRYLWNFHESEIEPEAWAATRLDLAFTCPASFAMREIFHAEPVQNAGFERNEGAAVGAHAHAWLANALRGAERLQPFQKIDARAALEQEIQITRHRLAECFGREDLRLPIWWETALRKAAWAARRCLAALAEFENRGWFYAMEKCVEQRVQTPDGALQLEGRIDLLLADRASLADARVIVFDFKTGKSETPNLVTLSRGSGFQFAAYFLMCKDAGARSVSVGVIRPEAVKADVFTDVHEPFLREAFAPLARLQRDLKFGQRGPLVARWGACERLPMATRSIDPKILEQKFSLFLLATRK